MAPPAEFELFPTEVLNRIFSHLNQFDLIHCERVSKRVREICDNQWSSVTRIDGSSLRLDKVAFLGSRQGDECMAVHQALEAVIHRAEIHLISVIKLTGAFPLLTSTLRQLATTYASSLETLHIGCVMFVDADGSDQSSTSISDSLGLLPSCDFPHLATLIFDMANHINWEGPPSTPDYSSGSEFSAQMQCSTGWHSRIPPLNHEWWTQALSLGVRRPMTSVRTLMLSSYPPLTEYSRLALSFPTLKRLYLDFYEPCQAHFVGFMTTLKRLRWSITHLVLSWGVCSFLLSDDLQSLMMTSLPEIKFLGLLGAKLPPGSFDPIMMGRMWPNLTTLALPDCGNLQCLQELIDESMEPKKYKRMKIYVTADQEGLPMLTTRGEGRVQEIIRGNWPGLKTMFWSD